MDILSLLDGLKRPTQKKPKQKKKREIIRTDRVKRREKATPKRKNPLSVTDYSRTHRIDPRSQAEAIRQPRIRQPHEQAQHVPLRALVGSQPILGAEMVTDHVDNTTGPMLDPQMLQPAPEQGFQMPEILNFRSFEQSPRKKKPIRRKT